MKSTFNTAVVSIQGITRIKRNEKSDLKNENSFEIERFLANFRAIKQSSSQQTKKYFFGSVVLKRVKVIWRA